MSPHHIRTTSVSSKFDKSQADTDILSFKSLINRNSKHARILTYDLAAKPTPPTLQNWVTSMPDTDYVSDDGDSGLYEKYC